MIRAGVGLSTEPRTPDAAAEAAERARADLGGVAADFCVCFVTAGHRDAMPALLGSIAAAAGTPYIVGCSAAGVIAEGVEVEGGAAVGVLAVASEGLRATPYLFDDSGDFGLTAGVRVGQRLMGSRGTGDLVLAWPDPACIHPFRMLQGIEAALGGVPVAGGAASAGNGAAAFQFSGTEVAGSAVSGLRLGGSFRYTIAVSQGCRPVGEPLRITKARDNLILELDGVPAIERLQAIVPEDLFDDPAHALDVVSVALIPDGEDTLRPGEYLVRNIIAADPDTGVMGIADFVEEGQSVVFAVREPGASRDDLARAVARLAAERPSFDYRFGLYFDCLARGRALYGTDGVDAGVIAKGLPGVPILGFHGNAELAPLRGRNQLFTYTGVLVLVGE